MDTIVNIAGYRFIDLPDRDDIRDPMLEHCLKLNLKGSILLSQNGINFSIALAVYKGPVAAGADVYLWHRVLCQ